MDDRSCIYLYELCICLSMKFGFPFCLASDKVRQAKSPMVLHGSTDRWICNNVIGPLKGSMLVILFVFHIIRNTKACNWAEFIFVSWLLLPGPMQYAWVIYFSVNESTIASNFLEESTILSLARFIEYKKYY